MTNATAESEQAVSNDSQTGAVPSDEQAAALHPPTDGGEGTAPVEGQDEGSGSEEGEAGAEAKPEAKPKAQEPATRESVGAKLDRIGKGEDDLELNATEVKIALQLRNEAEQAERDREQAYADQRARREEQTKILTQGYETGKTQLKDAFLTIYRDLMADDKLDLSPVQLKALMAHIDPLMDKLQGDASQFGAGPLMQERRSRLVATLRLQGQAPTVADRRTIDELDARGLDQGIYDSGYSLGFEAGRQAGIDPNTHVVITKAEHQAFTKAEANEEKAEGSSGDKAAPHGGASRQAVRALTPTTYAERLKRGDVPSKQEIDAMTAQYLSSGA